MLAEMDKRAGARDGKTDSQDVSPLPPTLTDLGLDHARSSRWQLLASLPDEDYEAFKTEVRADTEKIITQSAALAVAKHRQREQAKRDRAAAEAAGISLVPTIHLASAIEWIAQQEDCDLLLTDVRELCQGSISGISVNANVIRIFSVRRAPLRWP